MHVLGLLDHVNPVEGIPASPIEDVSKSIASQAI